MGSDAQAFVRQPGNELQTAATTAAAGHLKGKAPRLTVLSCFSLTRNWTSFRTLRSDNTMGCLDGMRCFSMAWVIFGHTIVYAMGAGGLQFTAELMPLGFADHFPSGLLDSVSVPPQGGRIMRVSYQLLPAAFFAVDTFFWMSGLLTGLPLLKQMRTSGASWFRFYPCYIISRWVRLTPLVIMAILFTIGIIPTLGEGPFWALLTSNTGTVSEVQACRNGGWLVDVLYLQNIFSLVDDKNGLGSCEGHLWYLSNDFQFFLLAPLIMFPFSISSRLGWFVLALVLAGSTAANVLISLRHHFSASPLFDQAYFTQVYVQPWCRIQPYLVGLALAVFWQHHDSSKRMAPWLVWSIILASAAAMLAIIFGTFGLYQHYPTAWGDAQNIPYIALSRLGWAVCLSALSYLCFTGEMPICNGLLSWWPLQIYAKLTFAAYVCHPLIMRAMNYSNISFISFTDAWYAEMFIVYLVWASLVAFVFWLLVEKPIANLLALVLGCLGFKRAE